MRRTLFTIAAALSFALCLASLTLWARSYTGSDSITRRWMTAADAHHSQHQSQEIQWTAGQMRFLVRHDTSFFPAHLTEDAARPRWSYFRYGKGHIGWDAPPATTTWNRLGFAAWETGWSASFADSQDRVWAIPAWLLCAALAILPAVWVYGAYRRHRRRLIGRCIACGYDLRATPDRCPECGKPADVRSRAASGRSTAA